MTAPDGVALTARFLEAVGKPWRCPGWHDCPPACNCGDGKNHCPGLCNPDYARSEHLGVMVRLLVDAGFEYMLGKSKPSLGHIAMVRRSTAKRWGAGIHDLTNPNVPLLLSTIDAAGLERPEGWR